MQKLEYEYVENLRKVAGTLPSEAPTKRTDIKELIDSIEIELIDHNNNPYKAMFCTSTATWGNNEFKNKWNDTTPQGKFEVIKAVLTHNTLPQAREVVNFIFRVKGVPRWLFDYHTQVKFMTIMSIGCRDNNKLDSDVVLTDKTETNIFSDLKDLYEKALTQDGASWQSARSFLPQSYSHSYYFAQNLLAISNSLSSFKEFYIEEESQNKIKKEILDLLYYRIIVNAISEKFPLFGEYLSAMFYNYTPDNFWLLNKSKFFEKLTNMKYEDLSYLDKQYFTKD